MKRIFTIALLMAVVLSCKEQEPEEKPFLVVSPKALSVTSNGGEISFEVTSNITFTAEVDGSCSSWISRSGTKATSGSTLTFEVAANDDNTAREGKIYVNSNLGRETISVSQGGMTPFMSVDPKAVSVAGDGGEVSVKVNSNVEVTVEISSGADWIIPSKTKSIAETTYSFTVSPNETYSQRTGEIKFSAQYLKESVTLTQVPKTIIKTDEFDPNNIAYSFACFSDNHVDGVSSTSGKKFYNALTQTKVKAAEQDKNGLDGVLVAGDLINSAHSNPSYYSQVDYYKQIYESVLNPETVPLVYTPGNHDTYGQWCSSTASEAKNISDRLGYRYFQNDVDEDARSQYECRHCVIGNVHVLCIVPNSKGPVSFYSPAINWLDNTLKTVTEADPERYVLILTHPMIYDTVYGSLLGPGWLYGQCSDYWYTKALTSVLEKYPQAVTFGGHLHFPINDPRSIWQGNFTALGCGSTSYMAIEDGKYENMSSTTVMKDCQDVSSGLLVQMDLSGNMRITKMFFSQNTTFGEPWTISYPHADKKHLQKYNHASLKAANTAPQLSTLDVEMTDVDNTTKMVTAKFAAGTDDEFVHHYVLTLSKGGSTISTRRILADFYRNARPSQMKTSWVQSLGALTSGEYELSLTAYDSWDAVSNTISKAFKVEAGEPEPQKDPELYIDLDVSSGSLKDNCSKTELSVSGAKVSKTQLSHAGKKYNDYALSLGKDKVVTCAFKDYTTSDEMQIFACNGFCVEAFFVDKEPGTQVGASNIHGIVCGTQQGGWGLALRGSGVPYFVVGDNAQNNYVYADATSAASTTELTHVVGVYDYRNKSVRIYVNGSLGASSSITGPFYPAIKSAVNKFCLGDDVKENGQPGDFPASDMLIVKARIYTGVMSDAAVKGAYDKVVAALSE